jgi:hypothetical protein
MTWTRRVGALLILAGLGAAPALAWRSRTADCASGIGASGIGASGIGASGIGARPPARPVTAASLAGANDRTGLGVELEVLHLRIELAWFESVPVKPARRLVFSLLADPSRAE